MCPENFIPWLLSSPSPGHFLVRAAPWVPVASPGSFFLLPSSAKPALSPPPYLLFILSDTFIILFCLFSWRWAALPSLLGPFSVLSHFPHPGSAPAPWPSPALAAGVMEEKGQLLDFCTLESCLSKRKKEKKVILFYRSFMLNLPSCALFYFPHLDEPSTVWRILFYLWQPP